MSQSRHPAGAAASKGGKFAPTAGWASRVPEPATDRDDGGMVGAPTYDDDGWHYHRNGICGRGFLVSNDGDGGLQVSFTTDDDPDLFQVPIRVPGEIIRRAAEVPVSRRVGNLDIRAAVADKFGVVTFEDTSDPKGTMVAITDLSAGDGDHATAVFNVEKLLAGDARFGHNSWRGDHYHRTVLQALRER